MNSATADTKTLPAKAELRRPSAVGWSDLLGVLRSFSLLLFLTVIEYHAITVIHGNPWGGPWRAQVPDLVAKIATGTFESAHVAQRILIPKLVQQISVFGRMNFVNAWLGTVFVMLLAANALTYFTLRRASQHAALFTVAQGAAFVCVGQEWYVLPPYDLADQIVWFLFAYCVFTAKRWWWFAALFVVELHNREVALFIPLWVFLDNTLRPWRQQTTRKLALGCCALAAIPLGWLYSDWLRKACLNLPIMVSEPMNWRLNISALTQFWPGGAWQFPVWHHTRYAVWAWLASIGVVLVACTFLKRSWFSVRLGLFLLTFWAVQFASANITESRTYFCITPFLLFVFLYPPMDETMPPYSAWWYHSRHWLPPNDGTERQETRRQ